MAPIDRPQGSSSTATATTAPAAPVAKGTGGIVHLPQQPFEEVAPFRLVGSFCNWTAQPADGVDDGLLLQAFKPVGNMQVFSLCLRVRSKELAFQVLSSKLGFAWRLFPSGDGLLEDGIVSDQVMAGGENSGHGCNFRIQEAVGNIVTLSLRVSQVDALRCRVELSYKVTTKTSAVRVEVGIKAKKVSPDSAVSKEDQDMEDLPDDPRNCTPAQIEPLQIVGNFNSYKLNTKGLQMATSPSSTSSVVQYSMTLRVHSDQVRFQVVSTVLGFAWRLYPKQNLAMLSKDAEFADLMLGGEKEGDGCVFCIKEEPCTVIHLTVKLQVEEAKSTIGVSNRSRRSRFSSVCIRYTHAAPPSRPENTVAAIWDGPRFGVQFPAKVLSVLGPELLDAAQTPDAKEKVLRQRLALVRRLAWKMQQAYDCEDVRNEVLALRQMLPHRGRRQHMAMLTWTDPSVGISDAAATDVATSGVDADGDAQEDAMSSSKPGTLSNSEARLIGTWLYNQGQSCYEIYAEEVRQTAGAKKRLKPRLCYEQKLANGKTLWGALQRLPKDRAGQKDANGEEWTWEAELTNGAGIRFRMDGVSLVSSYRKVTSGIWCKPVQATRKATASLSITNGAVPQGQSGKEPNEEPQELSPEDGAEESNRSDSDAECNIDPEWERRKGYVEHWLALHEKQQANGIKGWEGAKKAHLAYLKIQDRTLSRLALARTSPADGPEKQTTELLFGDMDMQYHNAVQHLPSILAARKRVMLAENLSEEMGPTVAFMCSEHNSDLVVFEANCLCDRRLRLSPTPHPDIAVQAATDVKEKGLFVGSPSDWFFGLDVSLHADWAPARAEMEGLWQEGLFNRWFGGPKAGKYLVTSLEELAQNNVKMFHLSRLIVHMQDQLKQTIQAMGADGSSDETTELRIERRVLLAHHATGHSLPPWEDTAGQRSRRLTMAMNLSMGHHEVDDGGALRLHRRANKNEAGGPGGMGAAAGQVHGRGHAGAGVAAHVPGGSAHWCIWKTHDFKQEVTRVKLPCGRWSIVVCAEDAKFATKLRGSSGTELALSTGAPVEADNFAAASEQTCAACTFSAGDGVVLSCPDKHLICQECLHNEIRRMAVPTCPACAGQADRVKVTEKWQLFATTCLEDLGCVCSQECIDPGARCVVIGQSASKKLNGKLVETLWYNAAGDHWEVRVFATGQILRVHESQLLLPEHCPSTIGLPGCPCWPYGRGIYPVSLGSRCASKLGIDECTGRLESPGGYPCLHGVEEYLPFDSIKTSIEAVLFFLRHNFSCFFHYNDMHIISPPQFPSVHFKNYRSSLHSFPHHHPDQDQGKLNRRIDRFRLLCDHARNVRGARPLIFIRFVGSSDEFQKVEELYAMLRLWAGPRSRLLMVTMEQHNTVKKLYRHAEFPRILVYFVGRVSVMDFDPIKEALHSAVYDEAGLLDCEIASGDTLRGLVQPFTDPHSQGWLTPTPGQDPAFFPDCPQAQRPGQGKDGNSPLLRAAEKGLLDVILNQCLDVKPWNIGMDVNTWDESGATPLHHLVRAVRSMKLEIPRSVRTIASLLLAHADPLCHDRTGANVLDVARQCRVASEITVLLRTVAAKDLMEGKRNTEVLYRALEMAQEPMRGSLANLLEVHGIKPIGEAEWLWRHPPKGTEEVLAEVAEEVRKLEALSEQQRKKEIKRLLLEWHPDKNPERLSLATSVFQYLQSNKVGLINR